MDPVDSLAWLKAMAWDLRGNMDAEIDARRVAATIVTARRSTSSIPAYPLDRNRPILDRGAIVRPVDRAAQPTPAPPGPPCRSPTCDGDGADAVGCAGRGRCRT